MPFALIAGILEPSERVISTPGKVAVLSLAATAMTPLPAPGEPVR